MINIVLVGGGHSHIEVLRQWALSPGAGAQVTLVTPVPSLDYTGMLPGVIAGHYERAEAAIDLASLAQRAGVKLIEARVTAIDQGARQVTLDDGQRIAFEVLSLDVGSSPSLTGVVGAREFAIPVKPVETLLDWWQIVTERVSPGASLRIAMVGGGAAGVETLLAMEYRLTRLGVAPSAYLITDSEDILPGHAPAVRTRMRAALIKRNVTIITSARVNEVRRGELIVNESTIIPFDGLVWATGAGAPRWLADTGLARCEQGYVLVDKHLRSVSHQNIFASGDCATQVDHPRPKSGVFAVKQGPILYQNIKAAAQRGELSSFEPQQLALALISTGAKHAVASRGGFTTSGWWVWRWKDHIDKAFVQKYRT